MKRYTWLGFACLAALLAAGSVEAQRRGGTGGRGGTGTTRPNTLRPGLASALSLPGGAYVAGGLGLATTAGRRSFAFYFDPEREQLPRNTGPQPARIQVLLPVADALVLFDGHKTQQQGTERLFETPPLPPGSLVSYTLTASWMENGKRVSREQRVELRPGGEVLINFTGPPR